LAVSNKEWATTNCTPLPSSSTATAGGSREGKAVADTSE
jgi:hypothetical protein